MPALPAAHAGKALLEIAAREKGGHRARRASEGHYLSDDLASLAEGDFNGDGRFNQLDILYVLQRGGYRGDLFAATRSIDGKTLSADVNEDAQHQASDSVFARIAWYVIVGGDPQEKLDRWP